jgi:hypothetical protein
VSNVRKLFVKNTPPLKDLNFLGHVFISGLIGNSIVITPNVTAAGFAYMASRKLCCLVNVEFLCKTCKIIACTDCSDSAGFVYGFAGYPDKPNIKYGTIICKKCGNAANSSKMSIATLIKYLSEDDGRTEHY